jgi:type I restriction enzyme S subunit
LAEVVRRARLSVSAIRVSKLEGYLRIDAEYYRPEYFQLLQSLGAAKAQPLKQFAKSVKRKFTPTIGQSFQYVEISEVDLTTGKINAVEVACEEAPSRAQLVVKTGDVIISAVRPARNAVALVTEKQSGFVCSSGFIVLRPNKIPPEFLFASLKARHVSILLDRRTTATMYPAVSESDVLDTPIIIPSPEAILRTGHWRKMLKDRVAKRVTLQ